MKFLIYYKFMVVFLLLFHNLCNHILAKKTFDKTHLKLLKLKAESQYQIQRQKAWPQCSDQPQSISSFPQPEFKDGSSEPSGSNFGPNRIRRTISHSGRTSDFAVLLSSSRGYHMGNYDRKIPQHKFTLALWCKPEGGQELPARILEAIDSCIPFPGRGWVLGIRSLDSQADKESRIYFSLHTWSKRNSTTLTSPISFPSRSWIHVAVTYDGTSLKLFFNGAQVAISKEQTSPPPTRLSCRSLWVGGDTGQHFRGSLDKLQIWNSALQPSEIQKIAENKAVSGTVIEDNFSKLDSWEWNGELGITSKYQKPRLVASDMPVYPQPIQAKLNPCGHTICDSPDLMDIYKKQWNLRKLKTLRYRVIVVTEDDGTNPTVSKSQIRAQHEFLQRAFMPYNISWILDEVIIRNSSLRRRSILLNCYTNMVGNGACDPECKQPATGNDGGDCENFSTFRRRQNYLFYDDDDNEHFTTDADICNENLIGNGKCDDYCNIKAYQFDGGDCCLKPNENCFDPDSPNRSYLDVSEFKSLLKLNTNRYINVYFAHWSRRDTLGVATFPWQKEVLGEHGGIILQPLKYGVPGQMTTLVHEIGHVLGLWHVHRGVSEIDCAHQCYEKESSLVHGDLCADTRPTPENFHCYDLQNSTQSICGKSKFELTPYTNYMSYADDTCADEFTPDQVSRMHCYIDLVYSTVLNKGRDIKPLPVTLVSAVSSTKTAVTLSWLPPISTFGYYDTNVCSFCSDTLEFSQYGYHAKTRNDFEVTDSMFNPSEATGPPDAESCVMSHRLWLPDEKDCPDQMCTLTVSFKTPVVPSLLQIWVSWIANRELQDIELEFIDGTKDTITNLVAQCDTPLTLPLFYEKAVTKIHIHTDPMVIGIDAVKIVSVHSNFQCSPCKPLKYRVYRNPPFEEWKVTEVDYPLFKDVNLQQRKTYEYKVQAWIGSRISDFSSPLFFSLNLPICGNGIIEVNESCDDGNVKNNDGCSSLCEQEKLFNCNGEPSICYMYDGDGICEQFEKRNGILDCGFYTPDGYFDQWPDSIDSKLDSPLNNIINIGPPILPLNCRRQSIGDSYWNIPNDATFWVHAQFPRSIVATSIMLYLASDGDYNAAKLQLLDSKGLLHHEQYFEISCDNNPQEIPILKDLSLPFLKTASVNITFNDENIIISAVRLRSFNNLNPPDIESCTPKQLYHPKLQKCHEYCAMKNCPFLRVKHAKLKCSGQTEGDICEVQCDLGYDWDESLNYFTCLGGEWHGSQGICKPIDCNIPSLAHADINCPDGTTYGKMCSFKCLKPARFNGNNHGLVTTECKGTGLWSTPSQVCQLTCSLPSLEVYHTTLVGSQCKNSDTFQFGESCRFLCKVGYHVEGHKIRKRNLRLQCDNTGSWTGPKCVPVRCSVNENITYDCTASNTAGSRCNMFCTYSSKKVSSVHYCKPDGTWNVPPPDCRTFA